MSVSTTPGLWPSDALVEKAAGDFIVHMDDDDHYAPRPLEGMLTLMADTGADFVDTGFLMLHVIP